jgi:probable rRNA maturation factor
MTELVLRNRQRTRPLNSPLLRRMTRVLLTNLLSLERCELAVHLVAAPEMARLNQRFLDHAGSTDVITFDYAGELDSKAMRGGGGSVHFPKKLYGEIFICIDDAVKQARPFRTTWQSELVRYLIHGVLHAVGYDDLTPADRCVMKREENRLLRILSRQFYLRHLAIRGSALRPRFRPARRTNVLPTKSGQRAASHRKKSRRNR